MKTVGSAFRRFAARLFGFGPLTAVGKWLIDRWREALLVCASTVLTYVIMEIGYRAYQYRTLSDRLSAEVAAQPSTGPAAQDQFMYDAIPATAIRRTSRAGAAPHGTATGAPTATDMSRDSTTRNASRRANIGSPSSAIHLRRTSPTTYVGPNWSSNSSTARRDGVRRWTIALRGSSISAWTEWEWSSSAPWCAITLWSSSRT